MGKFLSLKMPKSEGYRCCTRDMFSRPFRQNGMPNLTTYLTNYKLGEYVDIKANSAIQKGMPHKFYHGRTGRVFNVTPHAVGVIVNKKIGGRIAAKRVHVRVEHVVKSRCREEFLLRVKERRSEDSSQEGWQNRCHQASATDAQGRIHCQEGRGAYSCSSAIRPNLLIVFVVVWIVAT